MQLTTVEKTKTTAAMRLMVKSLFPSLTWRHHGIGVLQAYVSEKTEPELRVHIWARELLKHGIENNGDIHDHRFDLVSHVLAGAVGHEEFLPTPQPGGPWRMMSLTHARAAKETGYHGPTTDLDGEYTVERNGMFIPAGCTYYFPASAFHRSMLGPRPDVAITVVEKRAQKDVPARLLYTVPQTPVMAFGHDMDWAVVGPVLQRAYELL